MNSGYTADIGLEIHAELQTRTKMFCACPVVDLTQAPPNSAVCPVCAGMPGTLPVVNSQVIEFALRVALSLDCEINETSLFARKNYFYPDLPKGYQISQYEYPLAENGILPIHTDEGWMNIRIRRVHLEEDTAKLTHITDDKPCSLVDLNRAGIPLLEIVSEPDMHTIEQVQAYTRSQRRLLQYLGVNSGDLEKGVIRFEANVSIRPSGRAELGTRVEIKNLNSFKTMTDAIAYELARQTAVLDSGGTIAQETLGWDEIAQKTLSQRSKEEAHDYRYFPEPDLPPLQLTETQINAVRDSLPERHDRRFRRMILELGLDVYQANLLTGDKNVADFYENTLAEMANPDPLLAANWMIGEVFGLQKNAEVPLTQTPMTPKNLADLLDLIQQAQVNSPTAKDILARMFISGEDPHTIIEAEGLQQVSDQDKLALMIEKLLIDHPQEVEAYHQGKTGLRDWFFGQIMRQTLGKANPDIVKELLDKFL